MKVDDRSLERLRWRSRRGLLELDLIFERYWAGKGAGLGKDEAATLEGLLALPDNDLLDLVMGRSTSPDRAVRALVEHLKAV